MGLAAMFLCWRRRPRRRCPKYRLKVVGCWLLVEAKLELKLPIPGTALQPLIHNQQLTTSNRFWIP
jgi:hypothetical protein